MISPLSTIGLIAIVVVAMAVVWSIREGRRLERDARKLIAEFDARPHRVDKAYDEWQGEEVLTLDPYTARLH